jgi:hypothetical protein
MKQRLGSNVFLWFIPVPNSEQAYVFPRNPEHIPVWELNFMPYARGGTGLLPDARLSRV